MKDFHGWADMQEDLEAKEETPFFKVREVWWVALGHNIGFEEDGKGKALTRPVLVLRKFGAMFYGVPLSTTSKRGPFYHAFSYKPGRGESAALLTQARAFDAKRLDHKDGMVSEEDFKAVKAALIALIEG